MERFQLGAAAALTLLVFSGAATAQDTSSDAAANWAGIVACAQVDDPDRRQDCVEGVMRRAGLFSEGQAMNSESKACEKNSAEPRRSHRRGPLQPLPPLSRHPPRRTNWRRRSPQFAPAAIAGGP